MKQFFLIDIYYIISKNRFFQKKKHRPKAPKSPNPKNPQNPLPTVTFGEFWWVLLSFAQFCRVLPSFAEFSRVSRSFREFSRVFTSFHQFSRIFGSFREFFTSFREFSRVCREFSRVFERQESKKISARIEEFMCSSQESKNFYVLRKNLKFCRISVEPFVRSSCRKFRPSFCFIYRIYHFFPNAFAEAQFRVQIFMTYSLVTS